MYDAILNYSMSYNEIYQPKQHFLYRKFNEIKTKNQINKTIDTFLMYVDISSFSSNGLTYTVHVCVCPSVSRFFPKYLDSFPKTIGLTTVFPFVLALSTGESSVIIVVFFVVGVVSYNIYILLLSVKTKKV